MTHKTFNAELFKAFPALKMATEKAYFYSADEEPGTYTIFESILVPEIERVAASDPAYLAQLMAFVEQVAEPGFGNCNDLVHIGLGEWLPSSKNQDRIKAAAGPHTAEAIWRAERWRVQAKRQMNASPLLSFIRKLLKQKKRGI